MTNAWDLGVADARAAESDELPSEAEIMIAHGLPQSEVTLYILGYLEGRGADIATGSRARAERAFDDKNE